MINGREGFASPVSHTSSLEGRLDDKTLFPCRAVYGTVVDYRLELPLAEFLVGTTQEE